MKQFRIAWETTPPAHRMPWPHRTPDAIAILVVWVLLVFALMGFACAQAQDRQADYVLGTGDVIKISVYEHQDMSTEARISENGTIAFPLVGMVGLRGLTMREAENKIAAALKAGNYVPKPSVNILVLQFRSQQVSVLGHVLKPGRYPIDGPAKLSDYLAMAGGIAPMGGDLVVLSRTRGGVTERIEINQLELLQKSEKMLDIPIESGDVLFVPRAPSFYIYGEVQRPGSYRLEANMTVRQAMSTGGGVTLRGTQRGIKVTRKDASGNPRTYEIRLNDPVQADDVIFIEEGWL
ncbi:MAG: polysaccharide export protein EpsE [Burkholderiales bacterium]